MTTPEEECNNRNKNRHFNTEAGILQAPSRAVAKMRRPSKAFDDEHGEPGAGGREETA
jgi:hypothetical protein